MKHLPWRSAPARCLLPLAVALLPLAAFPLAPAAAFGADDRSADDELAAVNGRPITRAAFEARMVRHFGQIVRDRFIVFEKFVEQSMNAEGLTIPDGEVEGRLREISDQSLREEGKTLEQQLAERVGDPELFRHLIRLERALLRLTRDHYEIPDDQPVGNDDVIKWFRSARQKISVQDHPRYLKEGVIVRVGDEEVPESHAIDLLYLAFPRDRLAGLLREMAEERLVEELAVRAGIEVGRREVRRFAPPVQREEPMIERISLDEILKLARISEEGSYDRARRELLERRLVEQTISEEDLKSEFEEHRDWYLGRSVRLSQVFFSRFDPETGQLRGPGEFGERLRLLREIRKELEAGGDIEKLAFVFSEDASALRGGDVGQFPQLGALGEALNGSVVALDKGELAGPIESPLGCHLIKATEVRKRSGRRFSDPAVRERILDNLVRLRSGEWWAEQLQQARIELFPERLGGTAGGAT